MQKSCKPNIALHNTWSLVTKVSEDRSPLDFEAFPSSPVSRRQAFIIVGEVGRKQQMPPTGVASTVSGQLCVCGTYASLFFRVDHALLTPSVWDDSAAAFVPLACLSGPDCWLTRRHSANAWLLHLAVDVTMFSLFTGPGETWQLGLVFYINNNQNNEIRIKG